MNANRQAALARKVARKLTGTPAPIMTTRTEPFYAVRQRQRAVHHWRLQDWLERLRGRGVTIGDVVYKEGVFAYGHKLYSRPYRNGRRIKQKLWGVYWNEWLVLSKHAPKWLHNWSRANWGQTVSMWAPLTKRNVRESVRFAIAVEKAERVGRRLRGER
jgi:hypothetical protein